MSKATKRFSPEFRVRAVLMVPDNEGQHGACSQSVISIAAKIGGAAQTLNDWARRAEVASSKWPGLFDEMSDRMTALERENRELRHANGIFRKASAYFAMTEPDRRSKHA
ncbi:transposase [Xinfangfangia sp. D13-10-4-6]|uniref:transposase n=1 Tax=Pseudogemmobacter hezensis TaxID=2737662 RepID=UPI0015574752|nr:transposase [Pseudogemmobacter hezensis]NPD17451.1 transposase [Pseudogemmobacter hezensis]